MHVLIQPLRQASEVCIVSTFIVFIKEKISGEDRQMVQKRQDCVCPQSQEYKHPNVPVIALIRILVLPQPIS